MKFLKNERLAMAVLAVAIILSSLYGLSKKPVSTTDIPSTESPTASPSQEIFQDEAFELGHTYYDAGDFESAITVLKQVTEDSPCFADALDLLSQACARYREKILDTADKYVTEQDYKTAISIVDEALLIVPEDAELIGAQNKFKAAARTAAIEKADSLLADDDYPEAIATIEGVIAELGADAELSALHSKYIGDYKKILMTEAEAAYREEGYESAAAVLRQGIHIVGDDTELTELVAAYEACAPYSFYSLASRDSGYYYDGDPQENYTLSDSMYDVEKVLYDNVVSCMDDKGNTTRLNVRSEFKRISGTIFFRLDSNDDIWHKASIRIYGDGDLLYEKAISNSDASVYFEVDISNVIFLDVNIYTGFYSLSGNDVRFGGISDLALYKNIM